MEIGGVKVVGVDQLDLTVFKDETRWREAWVGVELVAVGEGLSLDLSKDDLGYVAFIALAKAERMILVFDNDPVWADLIEVMQTALPGFIGVDRWDTQLADADERFFIAYDRGNIPRPILH